MSLAVMKLLLQPDGQRKFVMFLDDFFCDYYCEQDNLSSNRFKHTCASTDVFKLSGPTACYDINVDFYIFFTSSLVTRRGDLPSTFNPKPYSPSLLFDVPLI